MNDRYLYRAKRTDNGEWVEETEINIRIALPTEQILDIRLAKNVQKSMNNLLNGWKN